ncbi:MAG: hypothetical protein IPJ65_28770 [Archangiaceae bacterium]|nr:hypothetical protein [Archangiaceae bacterium]
MKRALVALLALAASACGPHPVNFVGRISFQEDWGCGSAVESQNVTWSQCHAFKRHFDARTGSPVTTGDWYPGAMRPLAATVELSYVTIDDSGRTPAVRVCGRSRFQTNEDGVLNMTMDGCGPGTHATLVGRVYLQAPVNFAQDSQGFVRGLWRMDEGDRLLEDLPGFEVQQEHVFTKDGIAYAIPVLTFRRDLVEGESSEGHPSHVNLGNQAFLTAADADHYGYMRQVLSSYATVLELHRKLREALGNPGDYTRKMMLVDPDLHQRMYGVWFTDTWAHGNTGWMSVYRPDVARFGEDLDHDGHPDTSSAVTRLLSDTSTLSHEFGHGIVNAYAPRTGWSHYDFAGPMIRPDGMQYDWGHAGVQYADMGTAYAEGIPNSLGQYLLNRCGGFVPGYRPVGGAVPFTDNMWNPVASCDTNDFNACPMHHVRYQLSQRGVTSGAAFDERVGRLRALTAAAVGMGPVTSNSESRWGELGCDLLDEDSDVSQATGRVAGRPYLSNFVYQVGQYFDGSTEAPLVSRYADAEVVPEHQQLSMRQLLDAMAGFCGDGGCDVPAPYGAAYNQQRLKSTGGLLSPQRLTRYLVDHGLMTRAEGTNLLETNFMEAEF